MLGYGISSGNLLSCSQFIYICVLVRGDFPYGNPYDIVGALKSSHVLGIIVLIIKVNGILGVRVKSEIFIRGE